MILVLEESTCETNSCKGGNIFWLNGVIGDTLESDVMGSAEHIIRITAGT